MKKRIGEAWMPADEFGRSIPAGLGVNLLVADIDASVAFARAVLGADVTYSDPDFAVLVAQGSMWMLHADHAYLDHPMHGLATGGEGRGAGAEMRLYGRDPDVAEKAARARGDIVLSGALDKPHGLREAHILDPDGYCWVPSLAI